MAPLNALTIDVEDYFQVSGFERSIPRSAWNRFESRVVRNTERLLQILADRQAQATFFVLGWVADRQPRLVRAIRAAGHELASHSYWHRLVYELSPAEFREDLRRSRDTLQNILGEAITAYRAPSFSLTRRSLWAFEILAEEGFTVDSSVMPARHDRYGIPDANPRPHARPTAAGEVWEFPPSVTTIGPWRLPISGGGYFRLFPWHWTRSRLAALNAAGQPFMFYLHPWEIDPDQPRLQAGSRLSRFRHYVGLRSTEPKLQRLLQHFSFAPLTTALEQAVASQGETVPFSRARSSVLSHGSSVPRVSVAPTVSVASVASVVPNVSVPSVSGVKVPIAPSVIAPSVNVPSASPWRKAS